MKIKFGINYSSNAYVDLKHHEGGVMLNAEVASIDTLVRTLEQYYGLHNGEMSETDRQAEYFTAMSKVMNKGKNILTKSWDINSLGVSNECLNWRDTLVAAGWKAGMSQPSERLKILAETEENFDCPTIADRLQTVLKLSESQNPLPKDTEIHVAAQSKEQLPPQIAQLFDNLEKQGTKVTYEAAEPTAPEGTDLNKVQQLILKGDDNGNTEIAGDGSFEIWHFDTELDALRYIATEKQDDYDLYINSNGKLLDNVQRMLGQPSSGSTMTNSAPQIVQLFRLGLNLFEYPLNIRNISSWLLLPVHPLSGKLRYPLANAILGSGGIKNEDYNKVISNYLKGIEDPKERKKEEQKIALFLPEPKEERTDKLTLITFIDALSTWSKQRSINEESPVRKTQLNKVAALCTSLTTIIKADETDVIEFKKLESWTGTLSATSAFPLYDIQSGSRTVTGAKDIADNIGKCLWTDCYNYQPATLSIDFLNNDEKDALATEGCIFWDADDFNRAYSMAEMRPVLKCTGKAVVVTADTVAGGKTAKHPLLLLLEETFKKQLEKITTTPKISDDKKEKVTPVDNLDLSPELHINNSKLIKMRERESYSSLDNLIQFPIDYTFEKILRLYERESTEISALQTVKGTVAHAVIEKLFKGNADDIEKAISNRFDQAFDEAVQENGALLLLKENIIDCRLFKTKVKENLEVLHGIIKENKLKVVASEMLIEDHIQLLKDADADPMIKGFIDMVLETQGGSTVIFDFKWTSSKSYHKRLLEENASIQLALYKKVLEIEGKNVAATAYFTMPQHKLYTTDTTLTGEHVNIVEAEDESPLITKVINSYRFRRQQIENGIIENGEGKELDLLDYAKNTESENLVPLKPEYGNETAHATNGFSNYQCFKGFLK